MEFVNDRIKTVSNQREFTHLNKALSLEVDRRIAELSKLHQDLFDENLQRSKIEDTVIHQRSIITNLAEKCPSG